MKMYIVRRMYDPIARKSWHQTFTIEFNSMEEFKAELAKLNAIHPRWTGEVPRA